MSPSANTKKDVSVPLLKSMVTEWRESFEKFHRISADVFITPVRIMETNDTYTIFIIKRGLKPSSLTAWLTGEVLTLTADTDPAQKSRDQENETMFSKSFTLPAPILKFTTSYKDGVIKLVLYKITPRQQETKGT